ncbi:MAG: mechanosensitive ion channel family protein [Candidatus Magasanikbacteria bacterium]|jgi:small-conductance mechanosensitive channel|nr:mechanosensitive ion channel family protein [Candidatus Magasanikbacteria bacterium]MBT4314500.1 mechanosensitive ion channel family protein [Candidatus Magasanikbacteria bacterium]MBT4547294.1 mechanosensitive ion channel family protein [Candidatus Magasanikbacteria bacterium]MBT6818937.1 mechanosensitive ion channel family protein [Candidatus Magasanikbacteria bacterium]
MENYIAFLKNYTYAGNTLWDYWWALVIFFAVLVVLKFIQLVVIVRLKKLAKKTITEIDDTVIAIFGSIKPWFYLLVSVFVAIKYLSLPDLVGKVVYVLLVVAVVYEVVRAFEKVLDYWLYRQMQKSEAGNAEQSKSMMRILKLIAQAILWLIALLMIMSNLGINITSLVASLGIGGIAVALALQNVLSDLFSSFSIFMDKPFEAGDYIQVGTDSGTVERIGMKTTRVRTLLGEELVISNKELTSARVQNFKRMEKRREAITLGLTYETPKEKLEKIPELIKKVVDEVELATYDRCHFSTYGDFSLNFDIVYYIDEPDYGLYMSVKQKVNLGIFDEFAKAGIEFAYPTQLVYTKKG